MYWGCIGNVCWMCIEKLFSICFKKICWEFVFGILIGNMFRILFGKLFFGPNDNLTVQKCVLFLYVYFHCLGLNQANT